jgi:predicted kinase
MQLFLLRGLPGSGKSTLAKSLVEKHNFVHVEADQFFVNPDGVYHFSPETLKDAHDWCQKTVFHELCCGNNVVVSNVFSQRWEAQPYIDMCNQLDCPIQIFELSGTWESIHNVPKASIERMRARWEDHSEWFKETVE